MAIGNGVAYLVEEVAGTTIHPYDLNAGAYLPSMTSPFTASNGTSFSGATFIEESIDIVSPDSLNVVTGVLAQGGVIELEQSDNVDVRVNRNPLGVAAVVSIELESATAKSLPTSMMFTIEDSVFSRGAIARQIELFNYVTGSWEVVDTRDASRVVDSVVTVTPTGDASRFVEPATNRIEARIRYSTAVARAFFSANIDQMRPRARRGRCPGWGWPETMTPTTMTIAGDRWP